MTRSVGRLQLLRGSIPSAWQRTRAPDPERIVSVAANNDALPLQSLGKVDAEAAGEMVVAGA